MISDTIYALSSGNPPAGIAVVRISGPRALEALEQLAGSLPEPRRASLAALHDPASGELLDQALVLRFDGPQTATGEDLAELHLHGGRSVIEGALDSLSRIQGLRPAVAGEFTRRAFQNGRIDLTEAEGLADLLTAETQGQRRAALLLAGGQLSRNIQDWQSRLLGLSARVEAALDFSDEGDVGDGGLDERWRSDLAALIQEIQALLRAPPAERLKDGVKVVIAGPPNAGKSSLLNYLAGREAAITSALAGTTRDLVEAPISIGGMPFLLVDTAGLRDAIDEIERIGIDRAHSSLSDADLILWLGGAENMPPRERTIWLETKIDLLAERNSEADLSISSVTGEGIDALTGLLLAKAQKLLPQEGEVAINRRHRSILEEVLTQLRDVEHPDLLIIAENLRLARGQLDRITGRAGVEDMLDALFGTFCIGK